MSSAPAMGAGASSAAAHGTSPAAASGAPPDGSGNAPSRALFSPFALGALTLANRIVIPQLCQYACDDGLAGDWQLMHLGSLALSGAGLLIIEATAITREGRITPGCLGLWSDAHEAALGRVLAALRRHSAMPIAIQLAHAGRKGSCVARWRADRKPARAPRRRLASKQTRRACGRGVSTPPWRRGAGAATRSGGGRSPRMGRKAGPRVRSRRARPARGAP